MKEISDIIAAYDLAVLASKSCALATVVHVEGSSYRRPGARMLVTEDGMLTGSISGGCLEGDALRKALYAISQGHNKLVTYDTTDEDDAKFGVQLGCNGIVHILFEPIHAASENNPIELLKNLTKKRRPAVLATFFSVRTRGAQPGTRFFYSNESEKTFNGDGQIFPFSFANEMAGHAESVLKTNRSAMFSYPDYNLDGFLQFIPPVLSLIIVGAGNDAIPLTHVAKMMGWHTTVLDGRSSHSRTDRFPAADQVIISKPEEFLQNVVIDQNTVCVLMTHNYNYDISVFKILKGLTIPYIGLLGPKSKMDRMYNDLQNEGIEVDNRENIYSPIGLDIGAETAEEIALSLAAEIMAVMTGKNGMKLREKEMSVHS